MPVSLSFSPLTRIRLPQSCRTSYPDGEVVTRFSPLTRIRLPQSNGVYAVSVSGNAKFQSPDEDSLTPKYSFRYCSGTAERVKFQSPDEDSLTPKPQRLDPWHARRRDRFSPLTRIRLPQSVLATLRATLKSGVFQSPDEDSLTPKRSSVSWSRRSP